MIVNETKKNKKRILVVDDSEIDREILRSILGDDFDMVETDNGYQALEFIIKEKDSLDAILLDVSMPVIDGFSVLKLLRENNIYTIPVFMITVEATKDSVEKAAQFKVSEFIRKPFDREEVLKRLRSKLGVLTTPKLTADDIAETKKYIADLESVYDRYMKHIGEDNGHCVRMMNLMKILLNRFTLNTKGEKLEREQIELVSRAAYFCDIGYMVTPNLPGFRKVKNDDDSPDVYQNHTINGAALIRLNYSEKCRYFVQVCADMCSHHHERYDGNGYPHRILGSNNSIYAQMCGLVDKFDTMFYKYREHNELQFDFVISDLAQDTGAVSREVLTLLKDSKFNIVMYYNARS